MKRPLSDYKIANIFAGICLAALAFMLYHSINSDLSGNIADGEHDGALAVFTVYGLSLVLAIGFFIKHRINKP